MTRFYLFALTLLLAGLVACGSASDDPAQANVIEKPAQVAQEK